jgi:hypothetical protein
MKNGTVIRIEERQDQGRVFLHIKAMDEKGPYGTVVSFSYDELRLAKISDYQKFMGFECTCDPFPQRNEFGVISNESH